MSLRYLGLAIAFAYNAISATATIDLKTPVVEHFMGLGVQWDPYEYPPAEAEWNLTLTRLDYMKPAFFRVMLRADMYHPDYDATRLAPLFAILDYAQSRGVDVMLGEWSPPRGVDGPADPKWARMIAAFVSYLKTQKHYSVIRYYNMFNEPNGNWMWPQGKVDYAAWASGIRLLREEFDSHGLRDLPIAGPDNSGNWDWLDRCARDLPQQIGFWEMHWYVKDQELFDGDVEKLLRDKRQMLLTTDPQAAKQNLYMGEAGIITGRVNGDQQPRLKDYIYGVLMADFVAQVARAGWMGASAWDLDDALHVVNGRKHPPVPEDLTLKIWGFWNTQGRAMGHPEDEAVRPWFYTWSLMTRLFPKGARVVAVNEQDFPAGLRTVAAMQDTTRSLSLMLVNDSDEARSVDLRIPGWRGQKFAQYNYFNDDRPVDQAGFPVALKKHRKASALHVSLPSRGVVFLQSTD